MKLYKGNILSCDKENHVYKYLVEDNGRIIYVGDTLPEKYQNISKIELGERALIPSFADTHIHLASFATFNAGLNVMHARSNQEILTMLKDYVSRAELDSVCPDKPLFMVKYDGHACVVNTKLLEKIKNKVEYLRGYHEESGEMNQDAFFAISDYVTNSISIPKLIKNMQFAVDYLASKGIGMIHTVSGVGFVADLDVNLEQWFSKGLSNGMQIRVFMQTLDVKKAQKRKLPRIGGCFETALDGCFGSIDAALLSPYENSDNKGILYYSDEKIIDFCKKANRANLQIEMHAIGDAAFNQATKALKTALDDYPRKDHRHAIIHACLPTQEGLQICKDYNILLPVQSAFINWPQEPNSYLESILGNELPQPL